MRLTHTFIFILLCAPLVHAGMYRWVDANGKVHFSDKKPTSINAEDISDSVKQINTDIGGRSTKQQLQKYQRHEAARQTEKEQSEAQASAAEKQRSEQCQAAKRHLKILQGRVIFYDEDHNEVKVSEAERVQKAQELETQIKKYCG